MIPVEEKLDFLLTKVIEIEKRLDANHRYSMEIEKELSELRNNFNNRLNLFTTDLIKSQVEEINYVDVFQYKNKKYYKYFVKLVGNPSYFYLHTDDTNTAPKVHDYIVHRVEGIKIKEWHKLQ